jgi:hypothetical protein
MTFALRVRIRGRSIDAYQKYAFGIVADVARDVLHDPFSFVTAPFSALVEPPRVAPHACSDGLVIDLDRRRVAFFGGVDATKEPAPELRRSLVELVTAVHRTAASERSRFTIEYVGEHAMTFEALMRAAGARSVPAAPEAGALVDYLSAVIEDLRHGRWTRDLLGPWRCACGYIVSYDDQQPWPWRRPGTTPEAVLVERIFEDAPQFRGLLLDEGSEEFTAMPHDCTDVGRNIEDRLTDALFSRVVARVDKPVAEVQDARRERNVGRALTLLVEALRRQSLDDLEACRSELEVVAELVGLPCESLRL